MKADPNGPDPAKRSEAKGAAQGRAEAKYELFLESLAGRKPTGELLREWGFSSAELSRIRAAVRRGAMVELSRGRGRPRKDQRLKEAAEELAKVQSDLAEMAIQVSLLQAKQASGLVGTIRAADVPTESRRVLVEAINQACAQGMPVARACAILELSRQRYYAWRAALEESSGD